MTEPTVSAALAAFRQSASPWLALPFFTEGAADIVAARVDERIAAGAQVLPAPGNIFAALALTPLPAVKVVILGQDPYPTPGDANGLAFSYVGSRRLPASLKVILAEVEPGKATRGDLTAWAHQGVLLLNSALTVEAGQAGAHLRFGWARLADEAVAAWAAAALPDRDRRAFSAAVDRAGPPGTPDLGPSAVGLHALVTRLRTCDDADRVRWRAAVEEVREGRRSWAAAMHGASWAAHVSGRTRALAAAQLLAVGGFVDAGFTPADGARGVWNAVAGCVQALAVADLLDETSSELLCAPWVLAHGDWPPGGSTAAVPAQDHPHG